MTEQALQLTPQAPQLLMKPIATPRELISYHEDMTRIIKEALKDGTDYGVIPGTKKPTLYKAGAERINIAFGTHPEYQIIEKEIDHDRENKWTTQYKSGTSEGLYRYVYKCRIVKADGRCIGEGEGVCSTLEAKYISRPRDSENTACKMAQKRAFLAATLHAFGLSDRFTQDMEDMHQEPAKQAKPEPTYNPKPIQVVFNSRDFNHLEKLEKRLIELNIPSDQHQHYVTALHGKPFTREIFEGIMENFRKNKEKSEMEALFEVKPEAETLKGN